MKENEWFSDNDPNSLAQRTERVLRVLLENRSSSCAGCGIELCGHAVVFSIVAGHEARPKCLACLATENHRDKQAMRDEMTMFVHSKPCLTQGWRLASINEEFPVESLPSCHWREKETLGEQEGVSTEDKASGSSAAPNIHDDRWDAGDLGCGELVLKLRIRMQKLAPGGCLFLTATDPGAPEDIPAWCRLTGHQLVSSQHPDYFIERRRES